MNEAFVIEPVDVRTAPDDVLTALAAHQIVMRSERLPEDPPVPVAEQLVGWRSIPPFMDVRGQVVWNAERTAIIASAFGEAPLTEDNAHMVEITVNVQPPYRRQGLGRALLASALPMAHALDRRLVMGGTASTVLAGAAFCERIGAERGLEMRISQVVLRDLPDGLVAQWLSEAASAEFELGFWEGAYPDDQIEAIAWLHGVMNTAPRGSLDFEDEVLTPERIRQHEQSMFARGTVRWSAYVRERATGAFAGFSEVFWNSNRPMLMSQGATGVDLVYRGHGLGRWLKAAMTEKVQRERPEVEKIRTGNAFSNGPMLAINNAMGFKEHFANTWWQAPTTKVEAYLAGELHAPADESAG